MKRHVAVLALNCFLSVGVYSNAIDSITQNEVSSRLPSVDDNADDF